MTGNRGSDAVIVNLEAWKHAREDDALTIDLEPVVEGIAYCINDHDLDELQMRNILDQVVGQLFAQNLVGKATT